MIFQKPVTSLNPIIKYGKQIADAKEPATALDVTIQAQILDLIHNEWILPTIPSESEN